MINWLVFLPKEGESIVKNQLVGSNYILPLYRKEVILVMDKRLLDLIARKDSCIIYTIYNI